MKIVYHKMSLFDAPKGSVLVHGCNAQGVWGSGIAKVFKEKFPTSFLIYKQMCENFPTVGTAFTIRDAEYYVGCLVTSKDYGPRKDPPDLILKQTEAALADFLASTAYGIPIYSCKFNSGLFNVPWEQTEKLLLDLPDPREWNVCDPDL